MKIHFVGKSLWFMQNNNVLDKKRKKWRELLPDQYIVVDVTIL